MLRDTIAKALYLYGTYEICPTRLMQTYLQPGMTFVDPNSGLALRSHDKTQEEEASWLAGCLLLPRDALLKIKRTNWTEQQACEMYLVSLQMLGYRMNTSGVNIQHRRSSF